MQVGRRAGCAVAAALNGCCISYSTTAAAVAAAAAAGVCVVVTLSVFSLLQPAGFFFHMRKRALVMFGEDITATDEPAFLAP